MPLPDLNDASCHRWLGGQSIQDPIVGEVAVPAHFALFRREAVPGEGLRQRGKEFLSPAIDGAFVSSAMHPGIAPLTPGSRLAIEIIQVGKRDAWPEVILDHSDRALDFALGPSRQLHRLHLSQKEFSPLPIRFIPCTASSLRSSATGTTGGNIASRFTRRLSMSGCCQQPGPALLPLIPVSSSPPVALPFAWLICSSFPTSSDTLKRGTRRRQSVKPILPQM